MKTVQLPVEWIERLKDYMRAVRDAEDYEMQKANVSALLGYLDSLNSFLDKDKDEK